MEQAANPVLVPAPERDALNTPYWDSLAQGNGHTSIAMPVAMRGCLRAVNALAALRRTGAGRQQQVVPN